ncbi:Uncharacterised protein [Klebsiella quasipneumoniae]|nr:Uncharacterised protein [Klebsiella quasipneumoniae]VGH19009.1 Uncharacterised protein [Klebsiella quasipneumoniae]
MVGGYCSVDCYLFSFLPSDILPQPFSRCFRRQKQRPAVVNIDQPLIGRSGDNQKAFGFVSTFKWCTPDCRHEYRLAIGTMDKVGLLLVAFFFPFEPAIGKAERSTVLPQGFKHPAVGCGLNPGINQERFIPPPWRVTPVNRVEVQLLVAFAQEQNFSPWRHVVPADCFGIIGDVTLSLLGKISQVFFACL